LETSFWAGWFVDPKESRKGVYAKRSVLGGEIVVGVDPAEANTQRGIRREYRGARLLRVRSCRGLRKSKKD